MAIQILAIAAAGALGTLCRFGLTVLLGGVLGQAEASGSGHPFPWPTLVVNVVGCFAFGLVFSLTEGSVRLPESIRPWALIGFMGAFTTFSTFGLETLRLLQGGGGSLTSGLTAAGYVAASIFVGVAALFAGLRLGA